MNIRMYGLSISIIILICLIGCKQDKKTAPIDSLAKDAKDPISLEFSFDKTEALLFDSLMSDVFYVKLETTAKNLIGEVSQVLFTKDRIIVVDKFVANSVSVYDMSGKFLNNIGRLGQGPRDYAYLAHVSLTSDSSQIVINDLGTESLKYYALNGDFIEKKPVSLRFETNEFLNNDLIVMDESWGHVVDPNRPDYKPQLIVSDLSGDIHLTGFQSYYNNDFLRNVHSPVRRYGSNVYYYPCTNIIYQVTTEGFYPVYSLHFQDIPQLIVDEKTTNKMLVDHQNLYPHFIGDYIELEDALYFHYWTNIIPWNRFFLYSKTHQKVYTCSGRLDNPFFFVWRWGIQRYQDNYVVVAVNPTDIIERKDKMLALEKNLPPEKRPLLHALFFDLTEDDNPVLFFFRVKI